MLYFVQKLEKTNFEYFLYRPLCIVIYERENKSENKYPDKYSTW